MVGQILSLGLAKILRIASVNNMKKKRGFTLIELLNVVAIILIIIFVYNITYFLFNEKWISWFITGASFLFLLLIIQKVDFDITEKVLKKLERVFLSVEKNNIESLKNYVNLSKYNLDIYNSNGDSLLLFSVKCGHIEIIDYILSNRSKYLPDLPCDDNAYNYALVRKMDQVIDLFEKNGYGPANNSKTI